MSEADQILQDVLIRLRQGPNGYFFARPPTFLEQRIEDMESRDQQRAAVASLSSLGFTLAKKQGSPDASRDLMVCVDRVVRKLEASR